MRFLQLNQVIQKFELSKVELSMRYRIKKIFFIVNDQNGTKTTNITLFKTITYQVFCNVCCGLKALFDPHPRHKYHLVIH